MATPDEIEEVAHQRSVQTAILVFVAIVGLCVSMANPAIALYAAVIVGEVVGIHALNRWADRRSSER